MNFMLSIIKFTKFKPVIKFKKFERHNYGYIFKHSRIHWWRFDVKW